jgi:hypothetical protein
MAESRDAHRAPTSADPDEGVDWFGNPLHADGGYLAWGDELARFSLDSQLPVLLTWIVRLSMLPGILVLTWRVPDRQV